MTRQFTELVDAAQDQQQRMNEQAEARTRAKAGPERHPGFDGKHCVECGSLIPMQRRMLDKVRCVTCQEILEKKQKRGST